MDFRFGSTAGSAKNQRTEVYIDAEGKAAGSLWSAQALMSGESQKIDAERLHVDRADAGGLRGIHGEAHASFSCNGRNFGDGQQSAGDIGSVHDQNQTRVRTNRPLHPVGIQPAAGIAGNDGQTDAPGFEFPQRPHHGIVLHRTDDDVVGGVQEAKQKQIDRFGGVFGKNDPIRRRGVEQRGQRIAGLIGHSCGSQGFAMPGSAGVATAIFQIILHGCDHSRRLGPRCGGIVKVDRQKEHLLVRRIISQAGQKNLLP